MNMRTRSKRSFRRSFTDGAFNSLSLAAVLCFTASCQKEANIAAVSSLGSNVVARVQGNVISEESYRQKLRERFERGGSQPSVTDKGAVLREMIRHESVYAQAKLAKFDEQPEIAALVKNLIVSRFIDQNLAKAEPAISRADVQNYYRTNSDEFITPAAVRAAIIFFGASSKMTPEKRAELKQHARMILTEAHQAKSEADFIHLVQRHSEDQATRYRGGDLNWLTREECDVALGAKISATLFAMSEPNSFAPLVETSEGFYILKLRERREAQPRPLAEVEEVIHYRLLRAHQFRRDEEFFARMKHGLEIQINQALLESISIPVPEQKPPALPGTAQKLAIR